MVAETAPEAIIHQLTALNRTFDVKHFDRTLEETNRPAPRARIIRQGRRASSRKRLHRAKLRGLAVRPNGWCGEERGGPVRPLAPPEEMREPWRRSVTSRRRSSVRDWTEGIVLRYGGFYGPGTSLAAGRRRPI